MFDTQPGIRHDRPDYFGPGRDVACADMVGMGFFNHLGGALLGLAKGVILVSVLLFLNQSLDPGGKGISAKDRKESWFYDRVAAVFPAMMKTFGREIRFPEKLGCRQLNEPNEECMFF